MRVGELVRSRLALKCWLKEEAVNVRESYGGPLGLCFSFRSLFCFTGSLLSMMTCSFVVEPYVACFQDSIGMYKSFREGLRCLCSVASGHLKRSFPPCIKHRKLSLKVAHQAYL